MAVGYTVPNTFSPLTVAESAKVNANETYTKSVFDGLEATTKTLAKLKVDADPASALEVATKQYVDHYSAYRRPVLQYSSSTVVNLETGINGSSGQAQILFPDGNLRTDSTTTRINCNLSQVAALSGTAQSGLRTGTVTANTTYFVYAVKVTDNSSNFVTVADTVAPTQANYSTLNSNFGTSGWVYIGPVRYGDNRAATTVILNFKMVGNRVYYRNDCDLTGITASLGHGLGWRLASDTTNTSLTYGVALGTGAAELPTTAGAVIYGCHGGSTGANSSFNVFASSSSMKLFSIGYNNTVVSACRVEIDTATDLYVTSDSNMAKAILCSGFVDYVLGVGSNPLL